MNFKVLVVFVFIFHFSFKIKAQTCCSGGIPISNNIGLSILDKGTSQIGINYDYNYLNTLNSGTEKLDDNSRLRVTHSVLLNLGYAFTNKLSFEGLFTWVNQRRRITQFGNENLDLTSGVGDAILLVKYSFANAIGKNSAVNIGLGTKIPIGSTTKTNEQGITFNADLQPGSNTWDVLYWSLISKNFHARPSLNIFSRIIYRSTGTNNSYLGDITYKFGNEFQTYIGLSDQFMFFKTLSTPSISFKYRKVDQDEVGGFNIESTGGKWVTIIPNFSINITPKIVFTTTAEIPIYSNVDGTQLTPTYRLTSGLFFIISPKSDFIELN